MQIPLANFGERAWYAYQCLPRQPNGDPPSMMAVIGKVHRQKLSKIFRGEVTDPEETTRKLVAEVLHVSRGWLDHGVGDPPALTGPYLEMPRDANLLKHDPEEWARKYDAIGGVPTATPNNFQIAVLFYHADLDRRAIEDVAKEARGRENARSPKEWASLLLAAQYRLTGRKVFEMGLPDATAAQANAKTASKETHKKEESKKRRTA